MQYDEGAEPVQRLCRLLQAGSAPPHLGLGLVERNNEKKLTEIQHSPPSSLSPSSPSAPCWELTLCSSSSFGDRAPSPSGKLLIKLKIEVFHVFDDQKLKSVPIIHLIPLSESCSALPLVDPQRNSFCSIIVLTNI